jgi:DNA-binding NarL/FixJ family response regulator
MSWGKLVICSGRLTTCHTTPGKTLTMHQLSILLLGDTDRTEFHGARSCLDRWGTVHAFAELAAAAQALDNGEVAPEVIVVAQAFPGQFSQQAIDHLRQRAPLARVVGLMGSWCEGEMRTGSPWRGAVRTYWHQWATRCQRQLRQLAQAERCAWALPPTASDEERLLAEVTERRPPHHGLVVIHSRLHDMAEWLSAACRSRGFATVWQRPPAAARVEGALAAIVDVADFSPERCDDLNRLAATLHPTPVIALLAFPRIEDHRRALSAGAAAVVSKPLGVDDLFWELENLTRS